MNENEMQQLHGLVEWLKENDRLKGESWSSLTYWSRGVGVALRRYRYYSEHLRISGDRIDFHLYIDLSNGLTVFNELAERMPALVELVKRRYPNIDIEYASEPAKDPKTKAMRGSMVLAHFYIPVDNKEMLSGVYAMVYDAVKGIDKGGEVRPRGYKSDAEEGDDCSIETSLGGNIMEECVRIGPAMVAVDVEKWPQSDYAADVKELSELKPGVMSWVSTVEEVATKAAVNVNGVLVKPAKLCIPPYQRKFAWKEQDIRQLCKDLLKAGDEGNYHIGTVILHHERKHGEEVWNVVDGQQRLTSIMAILDAPIFELPIKQFASRDYMMIRQVMSDYSEDEHRKIQERLARCTLAFISVENVSEAFQLFTTQNGRGKPLTPVNLLKAYHYKAMEVDRQRMDVDDFDQLLNRIECEWESANVASTPGDGKLLLHVFREYLFRLRLWSRGKFPQIPFDASNIGEFKGVTILEGGEGLPLQNGAVLRTGVPESDAFVAHRLPDDNMNPFVSITQTIVNGSDFFLYAQSYVSAYNKVFVEGKVKVFYDFYMSNCKPKLHKSGAAMYARHVFEALCMFCYDRFGAEGLKACYRSLFACAYFERVSQTRVLYRRCGSTYAPRAIEAMMTNYSVADVQEALSELRSEIHLALNAADYVKNLLKNEHPTRGEMMQRSAYETIMK